MKLTSYQALLLSASLLAPLPALAVSDPAPGPRDTRVRNAAYDPQQVYRLYSTGRSPLQLIFEAGERPMTIAGSMVFTDPKEAKDWLAHPSGNVLILQPLRDMNDEPSVLFVRSATADGRERHYAFELHTRDGSMANLADKQAYMTVQFAYKPPPPTPEMMAMAQERRRRETDLAAERAMKIRFSATPVSRNFAYYKRDPVGCPLLAPIYVFDDGHRTTMVFAPHAVLPEIYTMNQDGKPAVVTTINDTTATGLQVVVPTVQQTMWLRRGAKVCELRNSAFDPIGTQPGEGSGTISPAVQRTVRAP